MQDYLSHSAVRGATCRVPIHSRFLEIECDLGIAGLQKPIWDAYVEAYEIFAQTLREADAETEIPSSPCDSAPSLRCVLQGRWHRLHIERKGVRQLMDASDDLFQSLTPSQRWQANRLLTALVRGLSSEERPILETVHCDVQ